MHGVGLSRGTTCDSTDQGIPALEDEEFFSNIVNTLAQFNAPLAHDLQTRWRDAFLNTPQPSAEELADTQTMYQEVTDQTRAIMREAGILTDQKAFKR